MSDLKTTAMKPKFEANIDQYLVATGRRSAWVQALIPTSLLLGILSATAIADWDLFARVAVGHLIEKTGSLPRVDPFSFTSDKPWIDHEWLTGVLLNGVASIGGDRALLILTCLSVYFTSTLTLLTFRRRGGTDSLGLVLLSIGIVAMSFIWSSVVRAHVFTYLLYAWTLYLFVGWGDKPRPAHLLYLPLSVVWANLHGGFVVGPCSLLLLSLGQLFTKNWIMFLWQIGIMTAGVAVTTINPYGWEYFSFLTSALTMSRELIPEWGRLPIQASTILPWSFVFLGLAMLPKLWSRDRPVAVLPIGTILYGVVNQRLIPIFILPIVIASAEFNVHSLASFLTKLYRSAGLVTLAGAAWGLLHIPYLLPQSRSLLLDYSNYPVGAIQWLRGAAPPGRILTHFNHGSYALWRLGPAYPVAIDGRYETAYSDSVVELTLSAINPTSLGHASALERLSPDYILFCPKQTHLPVDGEFSGEWQLIYRDESCRILSRKGLPEPSRLRSSQNPDQELHKMWDAVW